MPKKLPKDFFNKVRPTENIKKTLKDIIPVKWVKSKNKKEQ